LATSDLSPGRDLARIVAYFGATKLLTEIVDDDVARLVAWRRGIRVPNKVPNRVPKGQLKN
jgi:hypothetical protein